jgi:hypothetical protein
MRSALQISTDTCGQALVETTLFSVILTVMLAFSANFAYMEYLNAGITSAARQAAMFGAQGQQAAAGNSLPTQAATCAAAVNEVNGWLAITNSNWSASTSSTTVGGSSWTQTTGCVNGRAFSPAFTADPEAAAGNFTSSVFTTGAGYNAPIGLSLFGNKAVPSLQGMSRSVYMRQLN